MHLCIISILFSSLTLKKHKIWYSLFRSTEKQNTLNIIPKEFSRVFFKTNLAANNCETLANVLSCRRLLPDADGCIAAVDGAGTRPFDVSCSFIADCILIFLNVCNNLISIFSCGVSRSNQRLK